MNKIIKVILIILNLIFIVLGEQSQIEYNPYESTDKIFVKSLENNKNKLIIKDGIVLEAESNLIISHSQTSKYKRNLFSNELFKRGDDNTQDNIESITIYFNNNHLGGLFSKKHYPTILEPTISVLVKFNEGSSENKMEHYSTIKTLTFNQTFSICKILESVLDISMQPCSAKESDVFENLLHMGLVPDHLNLPSLSQIDFNDNSKTSNINRLRFLQSSKFDLSKEESEYYDSLLNSKSFLNCLSMFHHHKLCGNRKVNYFIEKSFNQLLGFTMEITKETIHFNEMALYLHDSNKINIKYIKDETHLISDPEQKYSTQVTLVQNNEKELYQLDKSKVSLLGKDVVKQQQQQEEQQWSITKLERSIKKSGFHRELVSNVTIKSPPTLKIPRECKLLFLEHFDQGIFVDRYEVDEIERFGGPKVNIYQLIDLEKPSATSTQNYISVVKEFTVNSEPEQTIQVTLPIHLRYQNPINSNQDAYRNTHISSPMIFIQCEPTNSVTESKSTFDHWKLITSFSPLFEHTKSLFIDVPVGQLKDLESVKFNTLTVTVIGSILVIATIIKTQRKLMKEKIKKK
ncbi:hypothetical protein DICPUDRAFT_36695 [Dictyostelium purpureum]|uniref:Phosphatidylinositol-glycan biosynthesis class X protein n=1 Tax=Dictyostelium purpureum TaxID=5786 RepID=F0ZRH3_DICPU|nr:uncharacterized protein DICPUDRAFT_36695 [Dictyostelium purpureum]EGC33454.1 hypothetical protein DICPUDRAFT_36695 [Dictyostelium purpureum]|eukprot:XP_003290025.1 hypothetical protein DICPUDRAFT_36695 [Dictyostelium purpureum]